MLTAVLIRAKLSDQQIKALKRNDCKTVGRAARYGAWRENRMNEGAALFEVLQSLAVDAI